jgi:hypothetical protein
MVVLSDAKPGREDEFNRWYDVHLLETIDTLHGFASGRRFELARLPGAPPNPDRYLAVHEVDGDSPEGPYEEFRWQHRERVEAVAAGRDPVPDTLDPDQFLVGFFTALSGKVPSEHVGERA